MDSESSKDAPGARRKVKFAPRAPPRRAPKIEVKIEVVEDADAVQAKDLLRRFNESEMKARNKVEKKVSASQIAFGYGGESTSIKSFRIPRGGSNTSGSQNLAFNGVREREYKEPWDYYSNYPVTLPLRRLYSGNPEYLDEEEFGEAAESRTYDEDSSNSAMELGLLEENPESDAGKPCKLNDLPSGLMGKMLVYKSGAIKLKLGNTLYDVSSGMNCTFAQDVVAVNTAQKHCCTIGEITKQATITPNVDAIVECLADL